MNTLGAQICIGCDYPDKASNYGEVDCEFAFSNRPNGSHSPPDIPVNTELVVMISVGMGLTVECGTAPIQKRAIFIKK